MFAIVKKVSPGKTVKTLSHTDSFVMGNFIGKRIPVEPIKGKRGWFRDTLPSEGFNWHSSWLNFAAKNTKVGRKISYNKRSLKRAKPRIKRA